MTARLTSQVVAVETLKTRSDTMSKKPSTQVERIVHNNTPFTETEVTMLKVIGKTVNNWRMRSVLLLEHPTDPEMVVSCAVGNRPENSHICWICVESREDWATALDYIAHGRIYVRD